MLFYHYPGHFKIDHVYWLLQATANAFLLPDNFNTCILLK